MLSNLKVKFFLFHSLLLPIQSVTNKLNQMKRQELIDLLKPIAGTVRVDKGQVLAWSY